MIQLPNTLASRRFSAAAWGLLLLLVASVGLGTLQSHRQDTHLALLEREVLPTAGQLREIASQVDELRGLHALHLMLAGTADAAALEAQLPTLRRWIQQSVAVLEQRSRNATEQGHSAAVKASLALFLAEHDKLLDTARQIGQAGSGDPDAALAAQARSLLVGPALQAYQRLGADLAGWWDYVDQQGERALRQARAAGGGLLPVQMGLLALAMLFALVHRIDSRRPHPHAVSRPPEGLAEPSHVLALNAAVDAAVAGPASPAGALLATPARDLAQQTNPGR